MYTDAFRSMEDLFQEDGKINLYSKSARFLKTATGEAQIDKRQTI